MSDYQEVIEFWFGELSPKQHWAKDPELDQMIGRRFGALHQQAIDGELWQWRDSAEGRLAEIIVLDQFSRNVFRDDPRSFAYDSLALVLAQEAIRAGDDQGLQAEKKSFMYMPFMHSESLLIHEQALLLFRQPGLENNYDFELKHLDIIKRFGRYPHRNEILGRESTEEEVAFWLSQDLHFSKLPGAFSALVNAEQFVHLQGEAPVRMFQTIFGRKFSVM